MAATATPFGFRPINVLGGQVMTHGVRQYSIASGYAANIFNGDPVVLTTAGVIERATTVATDVCIGIFMGVEYEDTAMGLLHRNFWPTGTTPKSGTTAWAYICDDPDMLFEAQADGTLAQTALAANVLYAYGSGNTTHGRSAATITASSIAATATHPFRIVDFIRRPGSAVGDAKTDIVVRFNVHYNRSTTGLA